MQDQLYTPMPYFFSKIISQLPENFLFIILYTIPVYFLSSLKLEFKAFFQVRWASV